MPTFLEKYPCVRDTARTLLSSSSRTRPTTLHHTSMLPNYVKGRVVEEKDGQLEWRALRGIPHSSFWLLLLPWKSCGRLLRVPSGWFQHRMLASLFPAWCWLSCGTCRLGRLCYQRGAWYSTGILRELPICSLEFDCTRAQTTACFSFANFWMQGGMGEAFGVAFTSKASRY